MFYFLEQARDHYEPTPITDDSAPSRTPPTPSLLASLHPDQLLSPTRLRLIARMLTQMCDAVATCHERGVFHRDIKPENFIVTDAFVNGERCVVVKLTDFGLSTTDEDCSDMDCGSAPYMSFECRNNFAPTYKPAAADVWSLGIVFINMYVFLSVILFFSLKSSQAIPLQPMDRHCRRCLPFIFPLQTARRSVLYATLRWHDFHRRGLSRFSGLLAPTGGIVVIVVVFFPIITRHCQGICRVGQGSSCPFQCPSCIAVGSWHFKTSWPQTCSLHILSPLRPSTLFLPALPPPLFSCGSPYPRDILQESLCLQGTLGEHKCGRKGRWCIGNRSGRR